MLLPPTLFVGKLKKNGTSDISTLEITDSEIEIKKLEVWTSPSRPPYDRMYTH